MTKTADDVLHSTAEAFAHLAFHNLARGASVRTQLAALFLDGFTIGAQLALVAPDDARELVESLADEPDAVISIANYVERIRSAAP